jgi:hypothetical protein
LLFHTGLRGLFASVAEAVAEALPVEGLRWITFGHVEADECGAMNSWLAAAPKSSVAHGEMGCALSVNDLADRMPRPLTDGQVLGRATDRDAPCPARAGRRGDVRGDRGRYYAAISSQ